jgi:hypothetical protein
MTHSIQETSEGLDTKLSLHYYSRMRFTQQLLPLLSKAAHEPSSPNLNRQPLSRVISVLGEGHGAAINMDDFDLKTAYSLKTCAAHAQSGNTVALKHLASDPAFKGITLIHSTPGIVLTNIDRDLPRYAKLGLRGIAWALKPWAIGLQESGERHLYAGTADKFGKGGAVLLSASSDEWKKNATVEKMVKDGTGEKVWGHTLDVFKKVCDEGGKY